MRPIETIGTMGRSPKMPSLHTSSFGTNIELSNISDAGRSVVNDTLEDRREQQR